MPRRQYKDDWERRKQYLTRPIIAEPPVLSPIPKTRESGPTPASPRYSPLPDLVIERVPRRHSDEESDEEFYNRLDFKMKRLYRRIFLYIRSDSGDDMVCDETVHYSNNKDVTLHDDLEKQYEEQENITTDDEHNTIDGKIIDMSEISNQTSSDFYQIFENITQDKSSALDQGHHHITKVASLEQGGEPHATSDTLVLSPRPSSKLSTEKSADNFTEFEENTDEDSCKASTIYKFDSEENENYENSFENSNNLDIAANRNITDEHERSPSENQAIFEDNQIARHDIENEKEAEIMRKQASVSVRYSMTPLRESSKRQTLDLNVGHLTMEEVSGSTIRTVSADMEIESEHFSPILQTSINLKRRSPISDYIQVSKRRKVDIERIKEVGAQTEPLTVQNISTQTDMNQIDFIMQMEQRAHIDVGVQTNMREHSERGTQTEHCQCWHFEFFHIVEGHKFNFFF